MPDRKKVLKGLTDICDEAYDRWVHSQYIKDKLLTLISETIPDAIALVRGPKSTKAIIGRDGICICENCLYVIDSNDNYCRWCGRKIKWNE